MSSIASRALLRAATRRQVSTVRTIARSFEPHPYQRVSKVKPAPGAYGKLAKNAASRIAFFVPGIALLLGWPYLGKLTLDGRVQ
ncbi:hypothetical protein jhhlp_006417 [Lomentospora prolificans]|uniref:Uncharacterized protein n=1 Tax=Lomentospora prolificans TaxID=41688 RepID=A0A2N3N5U1_9PEZI|nr:hypothetical protein jhhlp_006417 [Lomentospora prolificans]